MLLTGTWHGYLCGALAAGGEGELETGAGWGRGWTTCRGNHGGSSQAQGVTYTYVHDESPGFATGLI